MKKPKFIPSDPYLYISNKFSIDTACLQRRLNLFSADKLNNGAVTNCLFRINVIIFVLADNTGNDSI